MKNLFFLGGIVCLLMSGCETMNTPQQRRQQQARQRAEKRMADERMRRVEGRIDVLQGENARLVSALEQLQADIYAVNQQLGHLGSSVRSLDERQLRDKQEIASKVLGKLSAIEKKQSTYTNKKRYSGPAREHTVASGNTLSAIAAAYGTTVKAIKDANNLKSDTIRIGQKLVVPQ